MPGINAQRLAGQTLETDVCIVGAGAAGITIARELAGRSAHVCLVEAGGLEPDADIQALYAGTADGSTDPSYTSTTRRRYFGGSTNCWAGWCRPFDAIDFEAKPWLQHSVAWPFTRAEIERYYKRAATIVEVEPYNDLSRSEPSELGDLRLLPIRDSPPTRFGMKYRQELFDARNITTLLFANAKEFVPNAARTRIDVLEVVARDKTALKIRARLFVLASGGMENPRILLNSRSAIENGVGNHTGVLGRFFMAHTPIWGFGVATLTGSFLDRLHSGMSSPGHPTVTLSDDVQRQNKLMNAGFHLLLTKAAEPSARVVEALHPLFSSEIGRASCRERVYVLV